MSKAKRSTGKAQYERAAVAVREQAKYEREAAKLLGIPLAEVRQRIELGRKAKAEQEGAASAERRQASIRYGIEQIDTCLADVEDLANAIRRGECGGIAPEGVAHGIFAIAGRADEFLRDLCRDLGIDIQEGGNHAE